MSNRILEISTCVGCRMACSFCPQKIHVEKYIERSSDLKMSFETFEKCALKLPKDVEIMFAGMAEPWLNPRCTEMLLCAHYSGHAVSVYTTCVGMTPSDVDHIKNLPFIHFCIHLPDEEKKMNVVATKEYFDTLRACIARIPRTTLMCIGTLRKDVRAAIGKNVADNTNSLISRAGTVASVPAPYKAGRLKKLPCMEHNVLLPNGDVLLCCMDYAQQHVIGNLLTMEYEDVLKSPEFARIMNGLEDESVDIICRKCEVAEVCDGTV